MNSTPLLPVRLHPAIEALESRIAPAAVFTFIDVDGDMVTVKTTKGTNADLAAALAFDDPDPSHARQLQTINLSSAAVFAGTNLSVIAKRAASGDGRVNVGYIDGTSSDGGSLMDLGAIAVDGDLGRIVAGDATTTTPAVKLLAAHSIGEFGIHTQGAFSSTDSVLLGGAKAIKVTGSIVGALVRANIGDFGSVSIGGDLIGGADNRSGAIFAAGKIGMVKIGGSMIGGDGQESGSINAGGDLGALKIGGSVRGGSGFQSGLIVGGTNVASISIGGSLVGGTGDDTGSIEVSLALGKLTIGRDIEGSSKAGAGTLSRTGYVTAQSLGACSIGGSIFAGAESGGGVLVDSANIRIEKSIGSLTVGGDIIGRAGQNIIISAAGAEIAGARTDVALGKLVVKGRVEHVDILAGYNVAGTAVNPDAQIGAVTVGDFIASNLMAGVTNWDGFFGDSNDAPITINDDPAIISRIGAVIIKGHVVGTPSSSDSSTFGIAAQQIGSLKLGGVAIPLLPGATNDTFAAAKSVPISGSLGIFAFISAGPDVRVYEV